MISRQMKNPNRIVTPQPEIAHFPVQFVPDTVPNNSYFTWF